MAEKGADMDLGVIPFDEDDVFEEIILDDDEAPSNSDDDSDSSGYNETPERNDAFVTLRGHEKSVLSCAVHPFASNIVITGGMDDKACVWDVNKERVLIKVLDEFAESIDYIRFNKTGEYVVLCDLDGNANVYRGDSFEHVAPIKLPDACQFVDWIGNDLLFGAGVYVCAYRYPFDAEEYLNFDFSVNQNVGRVFPNGLRLVTGLENGTLQVFDLKKKDVMLIKPFNNFDTVHPINAIDVHSDNVTVICGCIGGTIFQANVGNGKYTIFPSPVGENETVEALQFSKVSAPQNLAASGSCSGVLRIWDLARQQVRHQHQFPTAVSSVEWHPKDYSLFVAHVSITLFDARTGTVAQEFLGHSKQLLSIALSADASLLVSTSEDKTAQVYKVASL